MSSDLEIVFLVGTGRCGSTLVHEILCRNEQVGFISNVDDRYSFLNLMGRYNNLFFRHLPSTFTRKGRLRFAPSESYNLISRKTSIYAEPCRDLLASDVTPWQMSLFCSFFEQRHIAQQRKVFSHKYTGWSRVEFFSEIFPRAKFVNIVRDGRAVANSFMQMPWWNGYSGPDKWIYGMLPESYLQDWRDNGSHFHELAAYAWKLLIKSYDGHKKLLASNRLLEIKYEDFISDHIFHMRKICEFAGLAVSREYERRLCREPISSSRAQSYRTDLHSWQVEGIEKILEDELRKYNYL